MSFDAVALQMGPFSMQPKRQTKQKEPICAALRSSRKEETRTANPFKRHDPSQDVRRSLSPQSGRKKPQIQALGTQTQQTPTH